MKVIPASSQKYNQNYGKSNLSLPQTTVNNAGLKSDVAFGSFGNSAKNAATGAFKWIDKMGFFVEFLIVDALSLIAPRIWIGLNRDKEKLGHYNYQAGAEEAGREMTSGPSMNIIPMIFFAVLTYMKPAAHIEKDTLRCLTHTASDVIKKTKGNLDSETLHKQFADKLFDDAFGEFNLDKKGEFKTRFSELLVGSKELRGKEFHAKVDQFEKLVISMNNKNKTAEVVETPKNMKIKGKNGASSTLSAADFIEDFRDYSKDIMAKLTNKNVAKNDSEKFLENMAKRRVNIKYASIVAAFFAVGSFLLYLPKFYQRGKMSPAEQSAMFAEGVKNENK